MWRHEHADVYQNERDRQPNMPASQEIIAIEGIKMFRHFGKMQYSSGLGCSRHRSNSHRRSNVLAGEGR